MISSKGSGGNNEFSVFFICLSVGLLTGSIDCLLPHFYQTWYEGIDEIKFFLVDFYSPQTLAM